MKKKWKITIAIVLALVLGAGAYLAYIFKFKEYDVADDEVEGIIANPYEVELPDGSKLVIGEDGDDSGVEEGVEQDKGDASEDAVAEAEESDQTSSTGNKTAGVTPPKTESKGTSAVQNKQSASTTKTKKKLTVAEVKGKYEPVFRQIEGQADDKINALIGRAKKEYIDKKADGEKISYAYFYNKYMNAANSLEAKTDATFYGVIKALESELTANGYNKSYAKSFIDEYETMKKTRRDGIIKKAMGR
ncbi:hypothetical protein AB1K89_09375 [Sporosarcina sp. 179-K 8C2 HS]|uniref:hypothetical protein n=1 Tax=Sporosarcina sp. 179-K 8C2 HS TaxID=3142387 RepID=UPI0039A031D4